MFNVAMPQKILEFLGQEHSISVCVKSLNTVTICNEQVKLVHDALSRLVFLMREGPNELSSLVCQSVK
jgi:hypothetical protein